MRARYRRAAVLVAFVSAAWAVSGQERGSATAFSFEVVAPGVELAASQDPALVGGLGPVVVHALRLDLSRVRVGVSLAQGRSPALERVLDNATRTGALAAVNAGFFLPSGAPAGLLAVNRGFVGLGSSARAALGTIDGRAGQRVVIGRLRAFWLPWSQWGAAWPATVLLPEARDGDGAWDEVRDLVGGAGLLVHDGTAITDWSVERLRAGFATERHPRTMAGVDAAGRLWLFVVDGRQPGRSIGMTFADLTQMAMAVGLRDAINLDGGGSTTMVVRGEIVNRPSDLTGPRAVSDVLAVWAR